MIVIRTDKPVNFIRATSNLEQNTNIIPYTCKFVYAQWYRDGYMCKI